MAPQPGPPQMKLVIPQLKPNSAQLSGEHSQVPH